jgi:Asp-tRNA(Asn)/Glu-tRNA(Gln) amidotransferase A subunit family amidase
MTSKEKRPVSNAATNSGSIYYKDATELAALIRTKQLSSREVVQTHLDRIAAVNPKVNAIVTLIADDESRRRQLIVGSCDSRRQWGVCADAITRGLHNLPLSREHIPMCDFVFA